jgi:hypothetical protein
VALMGLLKEAHMPGRGLEMVPMVVDALKKSGEAAGVRNIDEYYPEISEQDIKDAAADIQQTNGQPSPEIQIAQAQVQAQTQIEQIKAQMRAQTEQAQAQADLQVKQAEMQFKTEVEKAKSDVQIAREAAQLEADIRTNQQKLEVELRAEAQRQVFEASEKAKDRKLQFDLEVMKMKVQQNTAKAANHAKSNQQREANGQAPVPEPFMADPFAMDNSDMVGPDKVEGIISMVQRLEQALLTQSDALQTQTRQAAGPWHVVRGADGRVEGLADGDGNVVRSVVRGADGRVETLQ